MVSEETGAKENLRLPGLQMRKARNEAGISVEQAATALGLTVRSVRALEADDYEKLPAPVYVRGYIRSYCALVGISDMPILEGFESLVENGKQNQSGGGSSTKWSDRWKEKNGLILAGCGLALLLLIVLLLFFFGVNAEAGTVGSNRL